jgi:hypothetical protein
MEWVPVTGYENGINLADRPRRLTSEEIAYIAAHIPTPPSADPTAAELAREGIIEWLIETLREVEIAPSAIPELTDRIVEHHNKSLVAPGTPVGITAAEAVGATTTQMTLNTFHSSGSAKSATFGIEAMRDLIFARKTLKNESSTIYFTDKAATYEQILDKRKDIVGSMVADFISDYDIDSPRVLSRYWWHDTASIIFKKIVPNSSKVLRLFLNTTEMFKHRVTIAQLAAVLEREIPPSAIAIYGPIGDGIIDLYPDPRLIKQTLEKQSIAESKITPELAELTYLETIVIPDLQNIRVKGIAGIKHLYPIVSPVWRMVILERKLTDSDMTNQATRQFLAPYVDRAWRLFCNPSIMKMTGLLPQNLAALCQNAGLNIIAEAPESSIIVGMPNDRWRDRQGNTITQIGAHKYRKVDEHDILRDGPVVYKSVNIIEQDGVQYEEIDEGVNVIIDPTILRMIDGKNYKMLSPDDYLVQDTSIYLKIDTNFVRLTEIKPSEYISGKVQNDKQRVKAEIERLTRLNYEEARDLPEEERRAIIRRPVNVPRTDLMKSAEFIIAETDGSNLKELLALPGIDKKRTTCNNMYTITATLGIEAARTFLIRSLTEIIANTSSYIHPANVMFIAEFITSRGEPYGATYTGISRQRPGHLSLATLERAGKVFTQNALHGRTEDIRNVSASVAVGARMAIGSGSFDIAQDIVENGVQRTVINDDLFTALANDDASRVLLAQQEARIGAAEATITQEQLQVDVAAIKDLAIGRPGFDFTGEEETNLLGLFGPENFPELAATTTTTRPLSPVRPVRRVQPRPVEPAGPAFIPPSDLIDVISQIKIGIPIENPIQGLTRPLDPITPVPIPPEEQLIAQPIVSTGLVPLTEIGLPTTTTEIPTDINAFINRYLQEVEGVTEFATTGPITTVTELPRVEMVQLPDLTGFRPTQDRLALRREQISGLTPLDLNAINPTD